MTKAIIKIKFRPPRQIKSGAKVCQWCGSPLTKPESIARGYGERCFRNHSTIILQVVPVGSPK